FPLAGAARLPRLRHWLACPGHTSNGPTQRTARHPTAGDGPSSSQGSAGGRAGIAWLVGEPCGLIVDLHGDLCECERVLTVVVPAEQQFCRPGQDDPDIRGGTAPVTQVVGVQRLRWGHRSGHVRLPCPIPADGFADGFSNLRSLCMTTPSP